MLLTYELWKRPVHEGVVLEDFSGVIPVWFGALRSSHALVLWKKEKYIAVLCTIIIYFIIYFYILKMHKIQGFRPLKNESPLLSPPESLYEILYFVILLYHTFIYIKNHSFVCRYYFVFHIEIHNSFIHSNHFKIVCRKPISMYRWKFHLIFYI